MSYCRIVKSRLDEGREKRVISYCLYGIGGERDQRRDFVAGIPVNVELAREIYPGWTVRVHVPDTEPAGFIERLLSRPEFETVVVSTNINLRSIRYLPYDDQDVAVWISRDLDSTLNMRERVAVDEWLNSGSSLHLMHDNRQHGWPVLAGMFGVVNDRAFSIVERMCQLADKLKNPGKYDMDATYAEKIILEHFRHSYLQHYGAGYQHEAHRSFPPLPSGVKSGKVGEIVNVRRVYTTMKLEERWSSLSHLSN